MTAAAPIEPQLHFPLADEPERGGPWKTIRQVADALDVSPGHVRNLFDCGKLDMVIRIDSGEGVGIGSDYRILADSYQRYQAGNTTPVDYEAIILAHLCCLPAALSSRHVAIHFNISESLVVRLTPHFFDAASAASSRVYFRASRRQILQFVNKRRIQ